VIARVTVDPGDPVRAGQRLAVLELREIDAGLAKARSGAEKAERDLARARRLYQDSVMTLAQFQDTQTALQLATADLDAAAFNRRYAEILAPADGTVLRRLAEPGQTIAPGAPVLVLGSRARGQVVKVALADRDVVVVRRDDPAAGAPTSLVPVEAILEADGGHATVFALSADRARAERRRVAVAFIDGGRVAVTAGLEGARAVVTDGAAYLDDGAAVRVAP